MRALKETSVKTCLTWKLHEIRELLNIRIGSQENFCSALRSDNRMVAL